MTRNKSNRQQENNCIANNAVDKIILHENQKISLEKEAHENIESDFDESELYQTENMSIEYTIWKTLNDISVRLNANLKIHMILKTIMV